MANAKNTIQNIPLTGNLNLNKLKTDVASFEGYNEKNSTVFGSELTNIYTKETELRGKNDSYTIFNSKGEPFTFTDRYLYINNTERLNYDLDFPYIYEANSTVENTAWFAHVIANSGGGYAFQICITHDLKIYARLVYDSMDQGFTAPYTFLYDFMESSSNTFDDVTQVNAYFEYFHETSSTYKGILTVVIRMGNRCWYYNLYNFTPSIGSWNSDLSKYVSGTLDAASFSGQSTGPLFTVASVNINSISDINSKKIIISAVPFSGKVNTSIYTAPIPYVNQLTISYSNGTAQTASANTYYYYSDGSILDSSQLGNASKYINYIRGPQGTYGTVYIYGKNFYQATVEVNPIHSYCVYKSGELSPVLLYAGGEWKGFTGHDGNYFIPGIKDYYINGSLYAVPYNGLLIEEPGFIIGTNYYCHRRSDFIINSCTYKKNNKWFIYSNTNVFYFSKYKNNLDKFIINNRYIWIRYYKFYDIETKELLDIEPISYIPISIPMVNVPTSTSIDAPINTTGLIYASGANVNYTISKNPLVGILLNPLVMTDFPKETAIYKLKWLSLTTQNEASEAEKFYSMGDNVQSAKYQGYNIQYIDTVYPIDTNGNILYPITWNSKIIKGYSNNDLVINNDTTYPLSYWSPNQKIYAYYAFSAMSNIKGAFALQGQQYTFDSTNIYNVQFSNGIIQSSTSVCYIENMQYLGTLPTSAVFYSKYNKTFYKFTGDNILTKMFEANDIDEIRMVGQNPSTLSLWISTDKGIYVLSDTDMFKLNDIPESIYFNDEKTILLTKGSTKWIEKDISLYDIGNEGTPNPIKLKTKYYGLGGEHKALYDCWYIRLHSDEKREGKIAAKMNTITDTSFASNTETKYIEKSMYDENNQIYLKFQPKYQSGVAVQLELESDIPIYQISLGANVTDQVTQQTKFNF